jgi:hypothetical protein
MSMPSNRAASLAGKLCDPLSICVIVSVALALGTSVALRMLTTGSGTVYAATTSQQDENVYQPRTPLPGKSQPGQ